MERTSKAKCAARTACNLAKRLSIGAELRERARRGGAAGAQPLRLMIETRDAQFGARAGVAFAEGLVVRDPLVRTTLLRDNL